MEKAENKEERVVTVGTFDGVHKGHREVLRTLVEYGRTYGLRPTVVTFDRHPLEVVAPDRAPKLLQQREERDSILRSLGVDVIEVSFTRDVRSLTASEWIARLRDEYGARALVTGYDNKFGCDCHSLSGDDYKALGLNAGLDVAVATELPGVCSSAIRKAVAAGEMEEVSRMLGRDYGVKGEVVSGRRLGRTLGFPTANLKVDGRIQLPAPGVYAGYFNGRRAVINVGNNPTVDCGNPVTVEAHLLGFEGNLYGATGEVTFQHRIRDERKFGSLEELKKQIGKDVIQAGEMK